jgi:hypothetical protein
VNLKSSSKLNQGVVNFLELLQQLRPFFWRVSELMLSNIAYLILYDMKVSAAIYERFPDCAIFRRMKAFSCPIAQNFFAAWPGLCEIANRELEAEVESHPRSQSYRHRLLLCLSPLDRRSLRQRYECRLHISRSLQDGLNHCHRHVHVQPLTLVVQYWITKLLMKAPIPGLCLCPASVDIRAVSPLPKPGLKSMS